MASTSDPLSLPQPEWRAHGLAILLGTRAGEDLLRHRLQQALAAAGRRRDERAA